MRNTEQADTFEQWLSELRTLAANDGCSWIISSDPDYHRKAFEQQLSPVEEFERLQKISAESGCGCGT
ncbi:hypothetical protein [Marinobacter sp.]|uniref:hypothetical protein n=1 Tax=Marinobacter sp. TaxID=50741 RepID=UPI003A8CA7CB